MKMQVDAEEENYFSDESEVGEEFNSSQDSLESSSNNNATVSPQNKKPTEEGQIESDDEIQFAGRAAPTKPNGKGGTSQLNQSDKEEVIDVALAKVKELFDQSGFTETASMLRQHFGTPRAKGTGQGSTKMVKDKNKNLCDAMSEVTIYKNALVDQTGK